MRVPVFCNFSLPGIHLDIQNKLDAILDEPASFMFSMYENLDDSKEDLVVNFPDIFSDNPVMGEIILAVNHPKISSVPQYSPLLTEPTWKDILNALNKILIKFKSDDLFLTGLNIVGLTEDGMGHIVEPELNFYHEIYEVCGG